MKTYITKTGASITIGNDGIATVDCKIGSGTIGNNGVRYSYTLGYGANLGGGKRGLIIAIPGKRVALGLTSDVEAWLAENWPIRKTETEAWDEMMPSDARAMREYNRKLAAYEDEFNRRMESESESSLLPTRPADAAPEMTPEGEAWLKIDDGCSKHNYEISAIYTRARKSAVNGMSLTDALEWADREMDKFCDRHAWD